MGRRKLRQNEDFEFPACGFAICNRNRLQHVDLTVHAVAGLFYARARVCVCQHFIRLILTKVIN